MKRLSAKSVARLVDELIPLSPQDADRRIAIESRYQSLNVARARMGHHEEAATLLSLRQRLCPPGIRDLNFHLLALDLFALRVSGGQDVEDLLRMASAKQHLLRRTFRANRLPIDVLPFA